MEALSQLFDSMTLAVPVATGDPPAGAVPLEGARLRVTEMAPLPESSVLRRRINFTRWMLRELPGLVKQARRADAIHAIVPGDLGTIGIALGLALQKPLLVRHCGNWARRQTRAERLWAWLFETYAGGPRVMLATGGGLAPPSTKNHDIRWIFSTSLWANEFDALRVVRAAADAQAPRLVTVARQTHAKGTGHLLHALPRVQQRYPGATLAVLGNGPDLEEFRQTAQRLGIAESVEFYGWVAHETVRSELRASDVFCFPTTSSEGFPKAVLEAMAAGLPVVTTPVSVLPHLISDRCGIVVDEPTPQAIAEAVLKLLCDDSRYASCSANAVHEAARYSLESWRDTIRGELEPQWGPLKAENA